MARKLNYSDVKVTQIKSYNNCIIIKWTSPTIGFGNYEIFNDSDGKLIGRSEQMDSNTDKRFLQHLFGCIVKEIQIKG